MALQTTFSCDHADEGRWRAAPIPLVYGLLVFFNEKIFEATPQLIGLKRVDGLLKGLLGLVNDVLEHDHATRAQ